MASERSRKAVPVNPLWIRLKSAPAKNTPSHAPLESAMSLGKSSQRADEDLKSALRLRTRAGKGNVDYLFRRACGQINGFQGANRAVLVQQPWSAQQALVGNASESGVQDAMYLNLHIRHRRESGVPRFALEEYRLASSMDHSADTQPGPGTDYCKHPSVCALERRQRMCSERAQTLWG